MAKKEDDLDVLLPNWEGAAAHGFSISGSDDGIFIRDVVQNSPAGKSGVMKEGDQIVSATIYFDDMGYEEAQKILRTVDRHTVGLKLHRKGEKLSPGGSYSWNPERLEATSPDAVLSGDDEDYQRIYRTKIKPRLKSEDDTEASGQSDRSSNVHITRKVITRTIHTSGPTVITDMDIQNPEFKIKVPRYEQVTIERSGPKLETSEMDVDVNLSSTECRKFQMGDGQRTTHTMHIVKTKVVEVPAPDTEHGQATFHMSQINVSGGTTQTSDLDVKIAKASVDISAPKVDVDLIGPNVKFPNASIDVSVPKVTTDKQMPVVDITTKPDVEIGGSDGKMKMPSVKMPELSISGSKVRDPVVDINTSVAKTVISSPKIDDQRSKMQVNGSGFSTHDGKLNIKMKTPNFSISGSDPKEILQAQAMNKLTKQVPDVNISTNFPEADVKLSRPKIEGSVEIPGVNLDVEGGAGEIKGPRFKMPGISISGSKVIKPDTDLQLKGPRVAGDGDTSDSNLQGGIKGPDFNITDTKFDIEGPDVKESGVKSSVPSIKMPDIKTSDIDLSLEGPKLKGDHDIDLPSANIAGEVKRPNIDVDMPKADIEGARGKFHVPKFKVPQFQMSGPKVKSPDLNIDAYLPEADAKLTGSKIGGGVDLPDVDLDVEGGSGKIKGPIFKMPEFNISGNKIKTSDFDVQLKGPNMGGDVNVPDVNLEGDFKGPDMNIEGPEVDIGGADVKGRGLKFSLPAINMPNIKAPDLDFKLKGPKLKGDHDIDLPSANIEGEVKGPKVDVDVDAPAADIKDPSGRFHMPKFRMPTFGLGGSKVEGPDLNIDANLPEADVNLTGPKIGGGVDLPDVDLNVEGGSGKIKGPKFKKPEINISGSRIKKPDFNVELKGPKMGGDINVPDVNLEGDFKGPDMNIEGPEVDIGGADVKGRGLKFSLPAINMPNIKAPDLDFKLKGPKLKGDHDIDLPSANIEGEVKGPKVDVDVDAPAADIKDPSGRFHMPKFRMPTFGLGGSKVEGPDLNIDANLPEADVNLTGPKIGGGVDLPDVDVDVEGGSGKIKGTKFKMPEINISGPKFKKPDFNVELKGPTMDGDIDVPDVNLEGDFKGPDMNIEGPKVDIGGPDVKGRGLKFSLPAINMPNIKAPDLDFKLKGPKLKGDHDIDLPSANIEGEVKGPKADVDVDVPEADTKGPSGKFHMPKFRMPTFGLGGTKVEGPDLNIDANLPEADVNLTGPKIEGGVDLPDVDLDVEGGSGKIKGSKFKMPEFNISGPEFKKPDFNVELKGPKMGGDIDVPDVNLKGDFKGPDMNIEGPKVDIGGPDVKGSGLKFSLPAINMPNIKAPDFDFKLKGPKLKGDHDIDLPSANIEGEVKGPKVDVDVDVPEADIKDPSGRFHMPKFRIPTFGMGGSKVEGPDLNIDANLPEADVNLTGPKIGGGVDLPDVDVDVEGGSGKIKGTKFKMPEINISGPKFKKPDFNVELKGPKMGGDIDVPDVNLEGDFKGPDMNIEGPKVDIGGPDVKGSGLKFSLPAINMPNIKAPNLDFKLKGPKLKGDHDIDLPSANIEGEVKGPKVDVDVDVPEADIKGPSGKFHMPKFRMPTFGLGGTKVEGPDLNIDANLPEADVNLTGPKIEGGVDLPDVDLDVEGGSGKIKGSKFKMPEFNISGPEFKKPDFNVELKGPKMGGDVDVPDVNLEGDFKGPDMNIEGPKVDIGGPDVKGSGLKFSLPAINMPNIKAPNLDFKLKGPKLKGDHDIDLPSANIEGEVKGPKVDVDVDVPEADIKGPSGRFHMPKFRMPTFGLGGTKVEGPDLNIDANLPEADVNLTGPKIEGGVDLPDVDLDVEGGSGKIKGTKFKMPEINISGPKFKKPDFNVELKGPKMGGDIDVPDVNLEGDFKGPDMNIEGPKVDIGGPDVKGRGLKFSLPAINMPNIKAPDLDFKLKGPKLKGDHDIDLPSANIEGEIKGPQVDVDVDVPESDIKGPSGKFHMPKFRMPTFGMGGPKVEGPDLNIDANLPEADVNLIGPKVEGGVDLPDVGVDVEGGSGKIKGTKFKMPEFKFSGPKFKKPDFNVELKGPKMGGDVDVPDVNLEGDFKGPDMNIEGPKVDIGGPDVKGRGLKFSLPAINMPNIKAPDLDFKLKGPKLKGDHDIDLPSANIEGEVKGPKVDVDVDVPEADIKGPSGKFHMPKFRMPTFGMGGTKVEGPDLNIDANLPEADVNLTGPKIEGGVDLPDVDLDVEGGSGKIKGSKFKMPEFNISGPEFKKPDFNVELKGPKMGGDIDVPDVNLEGDFKGPDMNIEGPKVDIGGPDVKGRGLKFSLPAINMPNIKAPDLDFKLKGPKLKGDHDIDLPSANIEGEVKGPNLHVPEADIKGPSGKFHMPKFRMPTFGMGGTKVEGPDLNIDANLPEADVNLTGPKIEGGIDLPDVDLDVEGGSGKIKGTKFKMPEINISGPKFKKPDFNVELKGPKMGGNVDVPDVNLEGDFKGPDMNIEGPKVDIGGPDVKGRGLKFSLPAINMPNIKAPDLDFKLKGPKLKGDHDIDLPSANIEGEVKGPKVDVDVDVPEADIKGPSGKFHMPKFRMPTFGLGGTKVEGPDLNIDANLPEADVNLTGPKIEGGIDLPDVDLDVEGGSGKIKGTKFKMPEFNISGPEFKKPDFNVELKGPKMGGDIDVPDVNLEGDFKGPDMNIEGPEVDIGGPDVKGRGLKFSLPAINMPNIKAPDLDFKLKGPKLKGDHDIDLPSANIEGEVKGAKVDVDVDVPEADIKGPSGKFHMPKFRMPTFGLGGTKVEGPDLNIDANLPEADVNLTGPKIEGGVDLPDVDLDVEGGSGKIKGPKFKMPEFNISGPKFKKPDFNVELKGPKMGGDIDVPDVNLEGDFKGPDMNIEGPKVDIGGPDVKGRGLKFSLPAINMPNIKAPDLDFKLKGPKLKGDHDIDLPSANIEGEVKGPKVDVDVDVPEADIKGPSGKFHMPKFRMPTFGLGGTKVEGPDLNIDANLPEADVNLTGPKIEGGVDLPDVDLDVEGGSGKIKGPKFKMPEFNISGPKFKKPDFNVELKGPKMGGDIDVPDVNLEGDFKGPDMNIEGPKVDIGGPDVKGSGLKFSLPAINMPNIKAPDLDFKLKGPKLKGDHDIDLPSANIEGEVKGPQVDVDVDVPEADIKGPSGKFHMPKFRMPTFGMGGPKVEGPDLNIDANLPEADVNLIGPKVEGGVDLPDVGVDVEGGSGKIKGTKFKMPEFKFSGPKFKKPDFNVELKGPKMGGDVDVPDVNLEGDFKGPDMNIEGPKVDIGGPDVKGRGLKFSLPAINMPNIKAPDLDFKLKGPKLKGDHDIDLPSANIEGEIKGPKVDVDVDVPEADIKGPSGKFHMPKFRMPTFGLGGTKVEGPDLNIDANLPEADVNLTGPKIEGGVDLPDVDLDVEGGSGKIKGSKFKMPEFNISGPKFKKPDFNVELKGPKMGGDIDVPDVNLEGDFKGPDMNIEGPKVDIGGPDVKGRGLKFSLPAINMPNIKAPDLDFKLKGPKLKGDHDIDLPSANIEGEVKGPNLHVPEADIKGPSGKFHMPKFRMPTFGMGGTKVEGPDLNIDANLPEADVNLTGPKIEGGIDLPDVDLDVEGGSGKIKGPKFKMPEFNISGPKFKKPDFNVELKGPKMGGDIDVPDVNLKGDFQGPDMNIEGPKVDIGGPDVKGRGLKFSLPAINMPNIKAPDLDFKLKGPKLKDDHDIDLPSANIEGEIKGPKVDVNVDVPEADIKGPSGKFHMPKFRMPTFGMWGTKVEGPDLNIDANLPEADINLTGPKIEGGVDLPDVDLDVEGGSGKIKGPKFKMPEFNISGPKFKKPDFNVELKGPKMGGNIDVPDVNLEGDFKGPDMNIEGPKVDIGGPDVKGRGLKFSLPAINMPNIKAPDLDFNLKGPKLKGDHDIDLPSANIEGEVKGPKVDVPEADIKGPSGKFHMPKFRMPTFGMGGTKVEGPDLNIDANLPEADVNLTGPKIEGGVDLPDVDLDVEGGSGKIKGPKFKMPEFNISGPKFKKPDFNVELKGPKMGGDIDVPDVNLEGDFKGPDMNIEGPKVDIGGPDVKGSGLKFSLPAINMPNIKAPDLDFKLKGPKLKGDHDIDLPSANIEGEVKGPKVDVDVDVAEADIKGPSGKFHMPKFRMPTFGMGGTKVEGPDLNIDANLPEADVNLTGPKIEGGVDLPDVDLDVEGGSGKIKGPKFKMPEFNISGPKFKKPDFNVELKGPKMGGDIDVPDVNLEGDFKGPDMNIEGPKVDIGGPDVKGSGLKFSLPAINMPNIKAPDLDFKLKGPKLKGDHDIDLPSANIEGEIKGPKVDVDVDVPEADIKGPSGKFHMPKFRMPTFGLGGTKVEGPDLNIDANLPETDVNLTGPKIEGGVDLPDVDLDVEGGSGKIKGSKFKMPEFNISGPRFKKPDFNVELKGPKMGGDIDVPDVNLEGDFKGPDMNIEGPKVDIGGPDVKGRGLKFSLPAINMPNIKAPDLDFKLKGPKLKGDHDIDLPSANIEGEIKGPKVDVDVDVPEADIKGPSGKFHMPKFRMPTFGLGGTKVEGPDLNIDANLPEADVNLTGPKIEGGVDLPDVDLDVEGGSGKIKGSKFKMPEFNISGPRFKNPDFNVELKGPKMGGDIDVPDVNLEGDFKGPDMNIEGPKVDIGGPDVKGRGLKFSLPAINMPNIKAPDLDFKLKGPKLKGDHDIDLPSANIEGEIKGPKVDVDVDVPEADIKGPSGKFHMPKFRMPTFGLGGTKVEGPDLNIDANLPEADVNLTGPKIEGGVDLPDVDLDVEGGSGKIKGSKFKMPEFNISGPRFKKPDFNVELKGPKMGGDIDVPDVNLEGDFKGPDMNIEGPKVDIGGPDVKGRGLKFSLPAINMPNIKAPDLDFKLKGPKLKGDHDIDLPSANIEGEIKGPKVDVDVDVPEADIKGPSGKFHMPKFRMPTFGMGGTKVEGPDLNIDANLPEADVNLSGPKIKGGIEVPDIDVDADGKIKGPGFQMPGINVSLPKIKAPNFDLGFKSPELTGGVDAPDINMESDIKGPNFDIKGPKVDIKGPEMNIEGPDVKRNGHNFSLPSLDISGPNISSPDMNFDLKGPKVEGTADIQSPSFGIDVSAPDLDIDSPGAHLKMPKVKKPKFGFGIKGPQAEINAPSLDATGPDVDLSVNSPDLNISNKGKKGKFRMPKFNIKSKKPAGDVKVTAPKSDLDLSKPEVDIKSPDLNVSLGSSDGQLNIKSSKVKKPRFGKMKLSFPDVEFDLAPSKIKAELPSPKIEGDLQAPEMDVPSAGIKGPHVDIKSPGIDVNTNVDLEGSGFKAKGTKLKFPSVNIKSPKMSEPDLDINLKGTNLKGEVSGGVKGPTIDVKRPEIDFDVDAPNVDIEKPEGKLKMKMKKPKFNISGSKFKGSGVDIDVGPPKLESGIKGPEVNIDAPSIGLQPQVSAPDLHLKGSSLKGDVCVSGPTMECDIKGPNVNLDTSNVNIAGVGEKLKMPKLKLPSFGAGPDMDVAVNLPKADLSGPKLEGDINIPSADIKIGAPELNIDGHDAKVKGSSLKMPSWKLSGPKISSPDFDLKGDIGAPKIDMKGPRLDLKTPDVNFEGPEGKLKMPEFNTSGTELNLGINAPKIGGNFKTPGLDVNLETSDVDINTDGKFKGPQIAMPSVDISALKLDTDLKDPQLKGDVNISSPNIKGDFRGLDVAVKGPNIDVGAADIDFKGAEGKLKMPQINLPKAEIDISGQKMKGVSAPDFDINVRGPQLGGNLAADLSGPKIGTDIKCPKVDIKGPNVKMDTPDISFGGLKGKGPSIDFNVPKPNIGFSEPKSEGDMKGDINVSVPDVNLSAKVKSSEVKIPAANVKFDAKGPLIKGGVDVSSPKGDLKGPEFDAKAPNISTDIKAAMADFDVPLDKLTIPKFKHSQFKTKGTNLEGPEMAMGVSVPEAQLSVSGAQGPNVNIKGPQASVSLPEGEIESSGVRIKKGKIKMPKFNFSKSKGKSSIEGAEGEFSVSGPKVDIKGSKGSLGFSDIEIEGAEMSASGKGSGLDVSTSPKGKSGTLDFSLFKSKKSERHRSSSLSDEHELSPSSPKGRIEFGEGAAGAKGKKSKLKFGTFGGFGAKSKGSYEVTLGEGEAEVEGSGISLVSKKSRMSSSSSNESGSRAGFRLPKVELNINKNKE